MGKIKRFTPYADGWKTRRPRGSSSSEFCRRARGPIYRGKQGRSWTLVQAPPLRPSSLVAPCSGLRALPCFHSPLQGDVARVPSVCVRDECLEVGQSDAGSVLAIWTGIRTAPIWFFSHDSESGPGRIEKSPNRTGLGSRLAVGPCSKQS